MTLTCLQCGMSLDDTLSHCPKCDNALEVQHDGSTITVDIAHQGERVIEALEKLQHEVHHARRGVCQNIRLIVGGGRIREEAQLTLADMKFRGDIIDFEAERANGGAILVRLK